MFDVPPGVYKAITVGGTHACALTEGGEAACWDIARGEPLETPQGPYTSIAARRDATCAITRGREIVCWGGSGSLLGVPPGPYTSFSWDSWHSLGDHNYSCALAETREIACWLSNSSGESTELILPDPPIGHTYTAISVRHAFFGWAMYSLTVCARTAAGDALCWQRGSAHSTVYEPSVWLIPGNYATVAVSGRDFCGLTVEGEIEGCGLPPSDRTIRYKAVSPGEKHVCAVTDAGRLECWTHGTGWIFQGELFVMNPPASSTSRYTEVSVGGSYACALTEDAEAVCWGRLENKLALPDPAPGPYVAVSDGYGHTCALTEDGEAVCWGWNNFGQTEVTPGRYVAIHAGYSSTCASTGADELVCWGLGLPPFEGNRPTCSTTEAGEAVCSNGRDSWSPDLPDGRYVAISAGLRHGCGLTDGGEARCWGAFELTTRDGGGDYDYGPVDPSPGRYTAISSGWYRTCALTETGEVVCWGDTGYEMRPEDSPY